MTLDIRLEIIGLALINVFVLNLHIMKTCTVCKIEKPLKSFYNYKASKDGKAYRCKSCDDLARKKWRKENPEDASASARHRNWRHKYGIEQHDYNQMIYNQNNSCAICGVTENKGFKHFAVDHCHKTKKVRGLLCNRCNRCLGLLQDSIPLFYRAITYLKGT